MKNVQSFAQKIRARTIGFRSRSMGSLALYLIISVLVVACSTASTPPEQATNSPTVSQDAATSQNNDASQNSLPGTEEFGMTEEELVENIEAVEALIATCMSDAGFEYIAVDYDTVRKGMLADKTLPGVSDEEYIAQFGYGMSTLYTGLAPQTADAATPAQIGLGEQNLGVFNSLSAADQIAYNRALFGETTEATFAVTLEAEDFSQTGGCTRTAIEQVFTREQLSTTYYNPLDALLEQDPRMIAALAEFADCMREAGFNYNHPDEAETDISDRLEAITGGAPLETLSADAQAALTELQGEERALAVVASECEEEIIEPVQVQIERELYANTLE